MTADDSGDEAVRKLKPEAKVIAVYEASMFQI